jgi:type IV pilus assembly protein PilE
MRHAPKSCVDRGFTLIELVVAMVVIAILTAIAIPNYSAYVTRSKRAAAKTALMDTANFLERAYTTNGCYHKANAAACIANSGADRTVSVSAPAEGRASYRVTLSAVASQTFTLVATPCGAGGAGCPDGSDPFTDAECGNLTLTNTGARGITGTGSVATCWQR